MSATFLRLGIKNAGNERSWQNALEKRRKESTDFEKPHIEEGLYLAELKEVKEVSPGKFGDRVAFIYKILEKDVELAYLCYSKNPASLANKLGKALIAHGLDLGGEIDTDALVGSKVRVMVEDYDITNEKDEITGTGSSVSKVKPLSEKI